MRQDVLALQVIKLLRDAFVGAGLPAYLCPYGCLPTGYERGIIEVVPNTQSRWDDSCMSVCVRLQVMVYIVCCEAVGRLGRLKLSSPAVLLHCL